VLLLPEEANAVQERHSLGNTTPMLTVQGWSMGTEQGRTQLDEAVFVRIVQGGMA
jgi:hypothetical protein